MLEQHRNKLKQGAVLIDPNDSGLIPRLLFMIDHSLKESGEAGRVISRRLQFVDIDRNGHTMNAGWSPHLDLQAIDTADQKLIEDALSDAWITRDLEAVALAHASSTIVPEHFEEVKGRRERQIDKNLNAIHERLIKEINYWSDRHEKLKADIAAGKNVRLTLENVRRMIDDLTARLESRSKELRAMRQVVSATPVVLGGALVAVHERLRGGLDRLVEGDDDLYAAAADGAMTAIKLLSGELGRNAEQIAGLLEQVR